MIEMNPCPFCVSAVECTFDEENYQWTIVCPECGCTQGYFDSVEEAVEQWNVRI